MAAIWLLVIAVFHQVTAYDLAFDNHSWRTTFILQSDNSTSFTTIDSCLVKNDTIPFPLCHDHESTSKSCSCSDDCWITRKCCLNFQHGRRLVENARRDLYSCSLVQTRAFSKHASNNMDSLALVSRCPHTWHRQDVRRSECETSTGPSSEKDHLLTIPVTDKATNISYRNLYCAICNSVRDYVFWDATIRCHEKRAAPRNFSFQQAFDAVLLDDPKSQCQLTVAPPINVAMPPICQNYRNFDTCPTDWTHDDEYVAVTVPWLCSSVIAPFEEISTKKVFRNEYCLACSGTQFQALRCIDARAKTMKIPPAAGIRQVSFALLVDFRGNGHLVGMNSKCPKDQVFDVFKNACRIIVCIQGYILGRSGHCEILMSANGNNVKSNTTNQNKSISTSNPEQDNNLCSKAVVSASEYDSFQIFENGTLTLSDRGRSLIYGPEQYQQLTNESVILCFTASDNYVSKFPIALHSLTLAGSCLSIVALAIKIILFVALSSSRNLPMTIVLCLSGSLLVGQLLFLIAGDQKLLKAHCLCYVVAIAIHYSFLASFAWMNVLSFDLWRTFSNSTSSIDNSTSYKGFKQSNRFRKYSAYAWTLPAVIVICGVVVDMVIETSYWKPLYGAVYCMISSRMGLLVFFVAPMGTLLLTNVAFFVGTAWKIRETTRMARMASVNKYQSNGTESPCRFLLYTKLASIMGVTWISAFVAAYGDVEVLWYVFVAFNSIQGVYILVAFTPYRRVMRQLRRRFPRTGHGAWLHLRHRSVGKQRSTSSSSSTNTKVTYLGARSSVRSSVNSH